MSAWPRISIASVWINLHVFLLKKSPLQIFHQQPYLLLSQCALNFISGSTIYYFNGLVQERGNSIANALELRLSCTNPSILSLSTTNTHVLNIGNNMKAFLLAATQVIWWYHGNGIDDGINGECPHGNHTTHTNRKRLWYQCSKAVWK